MRKRKGVRFDPAFTIVQKLGGTSIAAGIVGRNPSQVSRWTLPLTSSGTQGVIPMPEAKKILRHAREHGLDIVPGDFFMPSREVDEAERTREKD